MLTHFTRHHFFIVTAVVVTVALFAWQSPSVNLKQSSAIKTVLNKHISAKNTLQEVQLPLYFEANKGQYPKGVEFAARTRNFQLFLQGTRARMLVPVKVEQSDLAKNTKTNTKNKKKQYIARREAQEEKKTAKINYAEVRMQLIGANQDSIWQGGNKQVGISSYFSGNNPKQWQTKVPHYGSVRYDNVYKGIDLTYYGNPQQLEYDFIVKPGADPSVIQLGFEGIDRIHIDKKGDAQLKVQGKTLTQHAPIAYQFIEGKKQKVEAIYTLLNNPLLKQQAGQTLALLEQNKNKSIQLGIQLASYNPAYELIIDPVLSYSTYLGGSSNDIIKAIDIDDSGAMYIAGYTESSFFPTGTQVDAPQIAFSSSKVFVSKLTPSGDQLLWTVFLDGSNNEMGTGIAVDSAGQASITGYTASSDFPTINAIDNNTLDGITDAFVAKITANGSGLVYSRFIGGSSSDFGTAIALDSAGEAYITGNTNSNDFPIIGPSSLGGSQDAFVTKLDANGVAVYSTYLGGSDSELGRGIAVDHLGQAYVTGTTLSNDFPVMSTAFDTTLETSGQDGFVTKINAAGTSLVYSSFLGGSSFDRANAIAVDSIGQAYITGDTQSTDFPIAGFSTTYAGGSNDAFISKVNTSGTALIYSRYLGGGNSDSGNAIAVSNDGQAHVTGGTRSTDFPILNAFQAVKGGSGDRVSK